MSNEEFRNPWNSSYFLIVYRIRNVRGFARYRRWSSEIKKRIVSSRLQQKSDKITIHTHTFHTNIKIINKPKPTSFLYLLPSFPTDFSLNDQPSSLVYGDNLLTRFEKQKTSSNNHNVTVVFSTLLTVRSSLFKLKELLLQLF